MTPNARVPSGRVVKAQHLNLWIVSEFGVKKRTREVVYLDWTKTPPICVGSSIRVGTPVLVASSEF